MRWSRGLLRCFGARDDDLPQPSRQQQSVQVLGSPTNLAQEPRRRIGRAAAVGRLATPCSINLRDIPEYVSASASPASVFALDTTCVLKQVHDTRLAAMLECVFVNAQAQKILGAPTPQAYHRLVFDQLVSVEELLLVELRDVLLSLLDPSSQQDCYCPLIAVAGIGPVSNLSPEPRAHNTGPLCRSCRRGAARGGDTTGSNACSSDGESDSSDNDDNEGAQSGRACTCNAFNATAMTAAALGLEGLRLHPCWIEGAAPSAAAASASASASAAPQPGASGTPSRRPGVILWHRQPLRWRHGRAVALRSLCMLTHLDHAVTLLSPAGRVLYQNTASRRYYGRLVGLPPSSLQPPPPANNDGSIGLLTGGTALGSAHCHASAAQLPGPVAEEESCEGEEPEAAADSSCSGTSGVAPSQLQLRRALTVADPGMLWAGAPEALMQELSCCGLVRHLFSCDVPELVQDMLGSWATGRPWKHLLQGRLRISGVSLAPRSWVYAEPQLAYGDSCTADRYSLPNRMMPFTGLPLANPVCPAVPSPACAPPSPSTQLKGLRWQPPEPLPSVAGRGARAGLLCAVATDGGSGVRHAPFGGSWASQSAFLDAAS